MPAGTNVRVRYKHMEKSRLLRILDKLEDEGYFRDHADQKKRIEPLWLKLKDTTLSRAEEKKVIREILSVLPKEEVQRIDRQIKAKAKKQSKKGSKKRSGSKESESDLFGQEDPVDRPDEMPRSLIEEEAMAMPEEEEAMAMPEEEEAMAMPEEEEGELEGAFAGEPVDNMPGAEPQGMDQPSLPAGAVQKDGYVEVSVFYGTDRKRKDLDKVRHRTHPEIPVKFTYKGERSANPRKLEFGQARVSIPEGHEKGRIEKPRFKIFREKPDKHVTLTRPLEFLTETEFVKRLKHTLKSSSFKKQALVFIHGYNVKFEDALERTAQLAYDLEYPGVPLLYSWPSNGRTLSYTGDEGNVSGAYHLLHEFLKIILADAEAEEVHIIAHSMGNRALTECLSRIRLSEVLQTPNRISREQVNRIQRVVFAAPDVDQDRFKYLAESFPHETTRYTLYASTKDFALERSQDLHSGNPRAGDSDVLCIAPHVESIDVSRLPQDPDTKHRDLLGHGYYGSSKTVLADVHRLFTEQSFMTADQRGHVPQADGGWLFNHERITIDENLA